MSDIYPPPDHMLRDLCPVVERLGEGYRASIPVVPEICTDRGSARLGVLAVLVDLCGGALALEAARPDWIATSDLSIQCMGFARAGRVTASAVPLRSGRTTVVLEVELRSEEDSEAATAVATMTFSRLRRRSDAPRFEGEGSGPRTALALPGTRLDRPFIERAGLRVVDAERGAVEIELSSYVRNAVGALQGGAMATLVDLAAEVAGRTALAIPVVTLDLAIHYLSQGRVGPMRTSARLLRSSRESAVLRIEVVDAGEGDRLVCVATATTGSDAPGGA